MCKCLTERLEKPSTAGDIIKEKRDIEACINSKCDEQPTPTQGLTNRALAESETGRHRHRHVNMHDEHH